MLQKGGIQNTNLYIARLDNNLEYRAIWDLGLGRTQLVVVVISVLVLSLIHI